MHFCSTVVVILSILTKETLQSCIALNVVDRSMLNFGRPYSLKKYIHCENEVLSADLHAKIPPTTGISMIQWLEINNTNSPEIAKGAFDNLAIPELRIHNAGVRVIDAGAFSGLKGLTQLSLRSNKIIEVKEYYFTNLINLEVLDLSFNNIAKISEGSFIGLKALKRLSLQRNLLTELSSQTFKDLTKLETFDLSFNTLALIDNGSFENLTNLNTLLLNNNLLFEFDGFMLSKNLRLTNVDLSYNYINGMNNLSFSSSLKKLNFSYNLIQSLSFSKYTSVQTIDLSSSGIKSIRNFSFKNLEIFELYLDHNNLGLNLIPSDIFSNLSPIQTISLSDNQIQKIDPNLFKNNKRLAKLNLANNHLSSLDVSNVTNSLQELNLSLNYINSELNVTNLVFLKMLDVSYNKLTEIAFNFLKGMKWLFKIDLSNNQISKISIGCFRDLKMLREIDLSHNYISTLEIGVFVGLDGLFRLDISHNKLSILNDGVFHSLRYLQVLNLGYNNVSYSNIDNALSHFTVLREIGLAGNDWTCNGLTNIVKQYKRIKIINVGNYDVTNVDGAACKYEAMNSNELIDLETKSFSVLSSKLFTNNLLLILILIVLVFKLIVKYGTYPGKDKLKSTFRRRKTEEELQLVNDC